VEADVVEIAATDAAVFIGLTAHLEVYLREGDEHTLEALVDRLRRDLTGHGLASREPADQADAVAALTQRLHKAVGDRMFARHDDE
jgi:hypothetical protein